MKDRDELPWDRVSVVNWKCRRERHKEKSIRLSKDYVISLLDINIAFYIFSLAIGIAVWYKTKQLAAGALAGYSMIIFAVTVLSRSAGEMSAEFLPFWSYRVPELREQILWNVIAFIPIGLLAGKLWRWKGLLYGPGLSCVVEICQLISCRGLFEFDDIIHNGAGTFLGVVLYIITSEVLLG